MPATLVHIILTLYSHGVRPLSMYFVEAHFNDPNL